MADDLDWVYSRIQELDKEVHTKFEKIFKDSSSKTIFID